MLKEANMKEILNFCYGEEGRFGEVEKVLRRTSYAPKLANSVRQVKPRVLVFGDNKAGKSYLIENLTNCVFPIPDPADRDPFLAVYESSGKRETKSLRLSEFIVLCV